MAFTVEERDQIIEAFETDSRPGMTSSALCPPSSNFCSGPAVAPVKQLVCGGASVTPDCSRVHFHESIVEVSGRLERRIEDKTNVKRWFSCPKRLKELLQSIRPDSPPSLRNWCSSRQRAKPLQKAILQTGPGLRCSPNWGWEEKDKIKMTPYNCRDRLLRCRHYRDILRPLLLAGWAIPVR